MPVATKPRRFTTVTAILNLADRMYVAPCFLHNSANVETLQQLEPAVTALSLVYV
jgi:hypothetical protein